jgi:hypothetical protein
MIEKIKCKNGDIISIQDWDSGFINHLKMNIYTKDLFHFHKNIIQY